MSMGERLGNVAIAAALIYGVVCVLAGLGLGWIIWG